MNRHVSTEQLSAYLDSEIGFAEVRQVEAHCSACAECGAASGFDAARRLRSRPGRARRAARRRCASRSAARSSRSRRSTASARCSTRSASCSSPSSRRCATAVVMGLALVVGLFTLNHEVGSLEPVSDRPVQEVVTVLAGAQSGQLPHHQRGGRPGVHLDGQRLDPARARRADAGHPRRGRQPAGPGAADHATRTWRFCSPTARRWCCATTWRPSRSATCRRAGCSATRRRPSAASRGPTGGRWRRSFLVPGFCGLRPHPRSLS